MVGGLQEVESVKGFSTSTQSPVCRTHRSPEDVFMTWLDVYFWYGTHKQLLLRMENPWFSQEILTNGDTLLDWKIRAILITFNQYVCWGNCIFFCLVFIFLKLHTRFYFIIQSYGLMFCAAHINDRF